jgi:hypothetical protein
MNASAATKRQILTTRRLTPAGGALSALGPSPCGSHRRGQVVVWEEVAPHMFRGVVNEGAQLWQGCASAGGAPRSMKVGTIRSPWRYDVM